MKISLVVAYDNQGAIGKNGQLAWHLPKDLKLFKETTLNKMIVMGRTTWNTLQIQPLPHRTNIVLSKNPSFTAKGALVCHSLSEVLTVAMAKQVPELLIIGGSSIYELFFPIADKIIATEVDTEIDQPDAYFVPFSKKNWFVSFSEKYPKDEKNQFDFEFKIYQKKVGESAL